MNQVSIADLVAYSELVQLTLMKYDFSEYPKLVNWMKEMESLPCYADVHKILQKVKASL
jgi:hypothetical protein